MKDLLAPITCAYTSGMKKTHTPINQLILDTKDLSLFPIKRIINGDVKYWEVTDLRNGRKMQYKTKRNAELAICSVIKFAMS
jgi:hypothetical protein